MKSPLMQRPAKDLRGIDGGFPSLLGYNGTTAATHLVGAAVKRATGVRWVADVRDSMIRNADRPVEARFGRRSVAITRHAIAGDRRFPARDADAVADRALERQAGATLRRT